MNERKVMVILLASPLTQNIFERIGVELISSTYRVIVFDCVNWLRGGSNELKYQKVDYPDVYEVISFNNFLQLMKEFSPQWMLDYAGGTEKTQAIQNVCLQFGTLYVRQYLSPSFDPINRVNIVGAFRLSPISTLRRAIGYFTRKLKGTALLQPDIVLLAGSAFKELWPGADVVKIFTATPDFFELARVKRMSDGNNAVTDVPVEGSYILFIDDCLVMSFDYELCRLERVIDFDDYFFILNNFFEKLEAHFNLPVIVAAHPNGLEYSEYCSRFGGRKVVFGATAELTRGCQFVTTHHSAAVSFAVLLRKKIMCLTFADLEKNIAKASIDNISTQLRCPKVFMDDLTLNAKFTQFEDTVVDESKYVAFERKYINSTDTPGEHPYENLVKYISGLDASV